MKSTKAKAFLVKQLAKPVRWSVNVPGSKSFMNRALVCAALATGQSTINDVVYCEDTEYMLDALQALGVRLQRSAKQVVVLGNGGKFSAPAKSKEIYIGNAGTVMRFLTPLLPTGVHLRGNERMQQRPLAELQAALQTLRSKNAITITGKVSSQFISALLLAAPTLGRTIRLIVSDQVVSAPYIEMTLATMRQFGVSVQRRGRTFKIIPQPYRACVYTVEGDASSATYWWTLAAMTGSKITVNNVPADTLQPDAQCLRILAKMGCTVAGTTVTGPLTRQLKPVRLSMTDCPDAVMSVAMAAAVAPGQSCITGVHHLVGKETNRLQALQFNLRRLGISARATADALTVTGRAQTLWHETIQTQSDHRLAMAFAVLGLARGGVTIDQPQCVAKSYPTFWRDVVTLRRATAKQHLILTGMRGVGKTTFGRNLAKLWHQPFVDLDVVIAKTIRQPIAHYVQQRGWPAFRLQERNIFATTLKKSAAIIATGGGTLVYRHNQRLVRGQYIVLLTAPLTVIAQRLAGQSQRPTLLKHSRSVTAELKTVWSERKDHYYAVADAVCAL